ncbi:hypothetical protein Xen7305DRAFT_00049730 [Xenococcus sp. PCC 7305]|uniref:hypothetical protein n=1 Tax=Xenococcus sp. PCC 7305 TaxID=102125 RepID=UPI0002ACF3A2|nr:hypothetical protein [Xenococcus sp. PCC 7305]ELS05230.1 hypothetical protein Xen7305DRAFT_00049730 [Xenococcus sp. PCC 7305]
MSEQNDSKVFIEDGVRPIEEGTLDIADTFRDAGIRPIEESPDYLVPEEDTQKEVVTPETKVIASGESKVISEHPLVVEINNQTS